MNSRIPHFVDGQVLQAKELNSLNRALAEVATMRGLQLPPRIEWANAQMLAAEDLNRLLSAVVRVYEHAGQPPPVWSFGQFESGKVIHASQLNEIGSALKSLLHDDETARG